MASSFGLFATTLVSGAESRGLTPGEIGIVPPEMRGAVSLSRVRIIDRAHNPFALGKILVRGDDIYWPGAPADMSGGPVPLQALFIHELAHVWQYATGRLTAFRYVSQPRNWRYRYEVREGAGFDDYAVEEQADLVQDWFRMRRGLKPSHFRGDPPSRQWLEAIVDFTLPPLQYLRG